MGKLIPFQNKLRQVLPIVTGNVDYKIFQELLMRIFEIIELSNIEKRAIEYKVLIMERKLILLSYRAFSIRLAESYLLQHFSQIDHIDRIKIPSKSVFERYEKMFSEEIIREINTIVLKAATTQVTETEENLLKLEDAIS